MNEELKTLKELIVNGKVCDQGKHLTIDINDLPVELRDEIVRVNCLEYDK